MPAAASAPEPDSVDAQSPDAGQHHVLGRDLHGADDLVQLVSDSVVFLLLHLYVVLFYIC